MRGHDAKSVARSLGLSVHTINERLRDARRKMAVASSREAARLLFEAEAAATIATPAPDPVGDARMGEAAAGDPVDQGTAPTVGAGWARRLPWIAAGVPLMMTLAALVALTLAHPVDPSPPRSSAQAAQAPDPAADPAADPTVVSAAQQWLALLDRSLWDDSYRATGEPFRKLNSVKTWTAASVRVRGPLGAMLSRTLLAQEDIPAPLRAMRWCGSRPGSPTRTRRWRRSRSIASRVAGGWWA